ncbi:MAG: phosphotransferase [Bacteroidales bacterium]|nr:phosphotransferase [Bacteroidales bacterium]
MNIDLQSSVIASLQKLFTTYFGKPAANVVALPDSGSDRKYFRLSSDEVSVIGSYNPNQTEHATFLYLSDHFKSKKLPVPEVLVSDQIEGFYLLQDLGDESLLAWIERNRSKTDFNANLIRKYERVLRDLFNFQIRGDADLDYSQLPVPVFDSRSMRWDLNYFKYYFLKPAGILFDEKALDDDFEALVNFLSGEPMQGFMYRDFQARNIMLKDEKFWYIDFQGGRKGPLQYDLVSLLFQVKAAIPDDIKEQLTDYYMLELSEISDFDSAGFRKRYNGFVLLRLLQVMGAYGFRGWFERKQHFIDSIFMLRPNLDWALGHDALPGKLPELKRILNAIIEKMDNDTLTPQNILTVSINSFSYRRGIPYDPSGHGGGFVFDCRILPNPGRLDEYKLLSGKDEEVISYLGNEPVVLAFVDNVLQLVKQAVSSFQKNNYTNLQINFGCTGGRHRSVYCAEKLAAALGSQSNIAVTLQHRELH